MVKTFNDMGLETFKPQGAFYVFPCIRSTGLTSDEFCEKLLEDQKVACVPGTAFGKQEKDLFVFLMLIVLKN